MTELQKIAVLGAGSWGTALALQLVRMGYSPLLWDRDPELVSNIITRRQNIRYLPGIVLPTQVKPTADLVVALQQTQFAVIVIPSQGFRELINQISTYMHQGSLHLIWGTKGLEPGSAKFLHQVVEEELGDIEKAILSGPSFAMEVAQGLPTAVTVAAENLSFANTVAALFHGNRFRVYTSDDMIGVELGGALKNVLAIAAGISDGLGFGANARAALITRGLSEIMRLAQYFGARRDTLMGLSGMGDLVLTCTDDQSRNLRLGLALGKGVDMRTAIRDIGQSVEGVVTAQVAEQLIITNRIEAPIMDKVYRVLYEGHNPESAVSELLARDLKAEIP